MSLREALTLAPASGEGYGRVFAEEVLAEPEFRRRMVQAVMDGLVACSRYYDLGAKRMVEVPDCKTRIATVRLALDHLVGEPIKRSIQEHVINTGTAPAEALRAELRASPALREAFQRELAAAGLAEPTTDLPPVEPPAEGGDTAEAPF